MAQWQERRKRLASFFIMVMVSAVLGWLYQRDLYASLFGHAPWLPLTPQLHAFNGVLHDLLFKMRGSVWANERSLDWRVNEPFQRKWQKELRHAFNGAFTHLLDIVLVVIDDETEEWLKSQGIPINPIPRALYGNLVGRLYEAGAKVIAFDLHMDTQSLYGADDDQAFATAMRKMGKVVLPCVLMKNGPDIQTQTPHPLLYDAAACAGIINMGVDTDGAIRAGTVAGRDPWGPRPALSVLAAGLWLGRTPKQIEREIARQRFNGQPLPLMSYTDDKGSFGGLSYAALLLNFAGAEGSFRHVPMKVVLSPKEHGLSEMDLRRLFAGKLVFVGATSKLAKDFFVTPFSATFPGVEIHATLAQMLLSGRFLSILPLSTQQALLLGLVTLTGLLVFGLRPLLALPCVVLLVGGCLYGALFSLERWLLLIPIAPILLAMAFTFAVSTAYLEFAVERQARHIRQRFRRFVAPAVLDTIVMAPEESLTRPRRVEATVLFSDLRGFTSISETRSPEEVATILNDYFEAMTAVIDRYEGTISKFIGDGIMALFGVPVAQPDHAARAVRCAVAMQLMMDELRQRFSQSQLPELSMRIGIHTGIMVFGAIGSKRQSDLTVIGDTVNVASRLESMNKELNSRILISEMTYTQALKLGAKLVAEPVGEVVIRGRAKPLGVFKVLGVDGMMLPEAKEALPQEGRVLPQTSPP